MLVYTDHYIAHHACEHDIKNQSNDGHFWSWLSKKNILAIVAKIVADLWNNQSNNEAKLENLSSFDRL